VLIFNIFVGEVTVRDPSASGFGSLTTPATLIPVSSPSSSTVSGALYGFVGWFQPYTLRFEVKDRV
jgi:hypothetical protein